MNVIFLYLIFPFSIFASIVFLYFLEINRKRWRPHGSFSLSVLRPFISGLLTSRLVQSFSWFVYALLRRGLFYNSKKGICKVFIAIDDPQSYILLQSIIILASKYNINFKLIILIPGLSVWDTNQLEISRLWTLKDCQIFALLYGFDIPIYNNKLKNNYNLVQLTSDLLDLVKKGKTTDLIILESVLKLFKLAWSDISVSTSIQPSDFSEAQKSTLNSNSKLLQRLGFYGPGVIEYEGEWYQPSRLHHLERRWLNISLTDDKNITLLHKVFDSRIYFQRELETHTYKQQIGNPRLLLSQQTRLEILKLSTLPQRLHSLPQHHDKKEMNVYYSFRSPYSQLILPRLQNLCEIHGIKLNIRVLMPMVMRGLSVPFAKVKFIALDCAREARLWGLKFGSCCDPINPDGKPVMRALDVFMLAIKHNKQYEFVSSFAELVWGSGVNAGTDEGMKKIVLKAGLNWDEARSMIGAPDVEASWRALTSANREYLYAQGMWGVPCVEFGDVMVWGQDKIWIIEQALASS